MPTLSYNLMVEKLEDKVERNGMFGLTMHDSCGGVWCCGWTMIFKTFEFVSASN